MSKNNIINMFCFGQEIGRVGYDEQLNKTYFQYNPEHLKSGLYPNLFPLIFKRMKQTQVFSRFQNETFRFLPPMIADSLPDVFGNIIFRAWLEAKGMEKINSLEQLAYVANRGMGALEYAPSTKIPRNTTINIDETVNVLRKVMDNKSNTMASGLNHTALLNVFKIGSSAGGAQPKILVSENKKSKKIIPGDIEYSDKYNHYLVKLDLGEEHFKRTRIEYCYYLTAVHLGIEMMPSHLIEDKHFATLRYDRQNGKKIHTLTATGLTGWDFKDPTVSSYENLFDLAVHLKLPHGQMDALFHRMVFNLVFANADDHLKNHAFLYDETKDKWSLGPAYDLTYSLNPLITYKKVNRALTINGKRNEITFKDLEGIAHTYTIKNPKSIVEKTISAIQYWEEKARELDMSQKIVQSIKSDFWLV